MSTNKMTLMERIDFIRANSVTDEEFKAMWGISIDEHVDRLMTWAKRYDELLEQHRPE